MKLDRNVNGSGEAKYALLKIRKLREILNSRVEAESNPPPSMTIRRALETLQKFGILDWGDTPESEFFVIRLKDRYANRTLFAYSNAVSGDKSGDLEYAQEVLDLGKRSGIYSPYCRRPD